MVRTRVGYTGGQTLNPTYYHLNDHTETLQIDYDPTRISYEELLAIFWQSHNPTRKTYSRQYMSAVFTHNETQHQLALKTRDQETVRRGSPIHTQILPATPFYLAEEYHQKYSLRHTPTLMSEFVAMYPNDLDFVNSTAVARVNGFVGGYGDAAVLEAELESYGLSVARQQKLREIMQAFK